MTQVELRGIQKLFGKTQALRGIDLTIGGGELMTLVGPSGCGKSTLLNIIAGLESPTEGDILFDDRNVRDLSPRERDIAFVFQSYALYPHMKVSDNIGFPLKMAGVAADEIRERVHQTAELLQIEDLLERKPAQLSGGQRQRVALGRAMIRRPTVFLLDEPLSNLDAKLRLETRAELKRLHRELKTTFVYVTHDQTEAMTLSGRLAVMQDGVIHQVGTPEEVYGRPADTFVATFIGSPPMNLLPATYDECSIHIGDEKFETPQALLAQLKDAAPGGEFTLGIRPESLQVSLSVADGAHSARVTLVEPLGPETYLHLLYQEREITARVEPEMEPAPDTTVSFSFVWPAVSCFDANSGDRLF
jgi:multiple sugar transport system ATP-binding protein